MTIVSLNLSTSNAVYANEKLHVSDVSDLDTLNGVA